MTLCWVTAKRDKGLIFWTIMSHLKFEVIAFRTSTAIGRGLLILLKRFVIDEMVEGCHVMRPRTGETWRDEI